MPANTNKVGETNPKSGTLQYQDGRLQGVTLHIPSAATITTCDNFRLVTLQEDANANMYAVLSPVAVTHPTAGALTIFGWGVLDEASQGGATGSVDQTPNTYRDGNKVVVRRMVATVFAVTYDPANIPAVGVGTARMDVQGRLTSVAAGGSGAAPIQLSGAVKKAVPGGQMQGQLPVGTLYYEFNTLLVP